MPSISPIPGPDRTQRFLYMFIFRSARRGRCRARQLRVHGSGAAHDTTRWGCEPHTLGPILQRQGFYTTGCWARTRHSRIPISTLARRIVNVWVAGARRFGLAEKNAVPSSKFSLADCRRRKRERSRTVVVQESYHLWPWRPGVRDRRRRATALAGGPRSKSKAARIPLGSPFGWRRLCCACAGPQRSCVR